MKLVRIKTEGSDIYPHNSVHKVLDVKAGVYPTLNESDRIPETWCEEIVQNRYLKLKGFDYNDEKGIFYSPQFQQNYTWNEFRRLGYYKDGTRTNKFEPDQYQKFEDYSRETKLNINKYD